jgi:RsiW-degrading membrane proteinase PrsW (M82 family)
MQNRPLHLPSLFLAMFSGLGILATIGGGLFMLLAGVFVQAWPRLLSNSAVSPETDFLFASGLFFCAGLLVPPLVYSLRRLGEKPVLEAVVRPIRWWQAIVILAAWAVVVFLGGWLQNKVEPSWAVTLFFYLPAVALPVILLIWVALGGLPTGSRQRAWGTFGVGLLAGTGLAFIAELIIYLSLAVIGIVLLVLNPEWMNILSNLQTQLSGARDLESIITFLAPYLTNPLVILLAFVVMAVLVPLIEELVKPVAVWLRARRITTPAQGFALGALSGAGFALLEGLMAATNTSEDWSVLIIARAGGSLMHILASGLMGWGIVSAWQEHRTLRLIGAYALSISMHGFWNAMSVSIIYGGLRVYLAGSQPEVVGNLISSAGIVALVCISVFGLVALPLVNRKLRLLPPSPTQLLEKAVAFTPENTEV